MPTNRRWNATLNMLLRLFSAGFLVATASPVIASPSSQTRAEFAVPEVRLTGTLQSGRTIGAKSQLKIVLPVNAKRNIVLPDDVGPFIKVVSDGLTMEFRQALAWHYGYSIKSKNLSSRYKTPPLLDLAFFLYEKAYVSEGKTRLSRTLRCMSSGERDMAAVMLLIALKEIQRDDRYQPRSGIPKDMDAFSQFSVAERLAYICHRD